MRHTLFGRVAVEYYRICAKRGYVLLPKPFLCMRVYVRFFCCYITHEIQNKNVPRKHFECRKKLVMPNYVTCRDSCWCKDAPEQQSERFYVRIVKAETKKEPMDIGNKGR